LILRDTGRNRRIVVPPISDWNIGDYLKALLYYERALAIEQIALSVNHPLLATSYFNIGLVYCEMEQYQRALLSFERTLKVIKLAYGDGHPYTKTLVESIKLVKKKL
jgi:tetratricopeptide (TPR) repeat protein